MNVKVKVFDKTGQLIGPIELPRVEKTDAEWRAQLTPEQYAVLREHATERPGSCALLQEHRAGTFYCAGCGNRLFVAERKTGNTLEYFDPGDGVSAQPTITGDGRLFVMSNRGILYAFDLEY